VVFYAGDKRAVRRAFDPRGRALLVAVRSDRHPVGFADVEIVQNASSADGARTFYEHNRGFLPDGNPEVQYALGNVVIDDLHRPPGQEKHTLWVTNSNRVMRWSPDAGPEGGQWKQIASLPGDGVRLEIAGRGSAPTPFAVVRRTDGEHLLRGTFAY
jgi:hypothetical protein